MRRHCLSSRRGGRSVVKVNDLRVRFEVGDAQALQAASATFDVVVSGLVLNFIPESDKALSEMVRVWCARAGSSPPTFGITPMACR